MRLRLVIIFLFSFLTVVVSGQRIVNKSLFFFPLNTTIDTIKKKFPNKFILTIYSPIKIYDLPQYQGESNLIPKTAKNYFKPTYLEVHLVDSLIQADLLEACICGDSLLYVKNQLYKWYNQQPSDFYKYKADREETYKKGAESKRKKIKKSDRYYFGYLNQQDQKRIVVLFDPKKIRYRLLGDIRDFDYCEPMVIDIENKKICLGFFPYPDSE